MRRFAVTLASAFLLLAVVAQSAMAREGHDGGAGWVGEANDVVVTNAGFIVIGAIPLFIFLMSLLQWSLERRKERRKALKVKLDQSYSGGW